MRVVVVVVLIIPIIMIARSFGRPFVRSLFHLAVSI